MKFKFGQSQLMPVLLAIVLGLAMPAMAQNTSQRSGLTSADEVLTRQQLRLDTFEESLKELPGIVEEDVRNSKTWLEKIICFRAGKIVRCICKKSQAVQAKSSS